MIQNLIILGIFCYTAILIYFYAPILTDPRFLEDALNYWNETAEWWGIV